MDFPSLLNLYERIKLAVILVSPSVFYVTLGFHKIISMCSTEIIKDFLKEIMCLRGSAPPPVTSRSSCNTTPNWFQSMTTNTETFQKLTRSEKKRRDFVTQYHLDPHNILLGLLVPYFI